MAAGLNPRWPQNTMRKLAAVIHEPTPSRVRQLLQGKLDEGVFRGCDPLRKGSRSLHDTRRLAVDLPSTVRVYFLGLKERTPPRPAERKQPYPWKKGKKDEKKADSVHVTSMCASKAVRSLQPQALSLKAFAGAVGPCCQVAHALHMCMQCLMTCEGAAWGTAYTFDTAICMYGY